MSIPQEHAGRFFYHFTHIENLDSILKNGLICTNKKNAKNILHKNVASEGIQNRRSTMTVTCGPGGNVHDYVPFYFTTTNPMLLGLTNSKNIDQPFLIFFAIPIEKLMEDNVIFTDASANTLETPNFYSEADDLSKLNWTAIDYKKWSSPTDEHRHQRMAEVLIYDSLPIDWVSNIIVWNQAFMDETKKIFELNNIVPPVIQFQPHNRKFFYFLKFGIIGRERETLVTGPIYLENLFKTVQKNIIEKRENQDSFRNENIKEMLTDITKNFTAISELQGIYNLETLNDVHSGNVDSHTLEVVNNLENVQFFTELTESDQNIVVLCAYLHDIGKGPKSKWPSGKQPAYPDHPADSLKMLERILSEDIKDLTLEQIRTICLLVGYHDLLGDIVGRGRSITELLKMVKTENELNMLIALSLADIKAIRRDWYYNLSKEIPNIVKEFKQHNK
jgi:hypothetical protein